MSHKKSRVPHAFIQRRIDQAVVAALSAQAEQFEKCLHTQEAQAKSDISAQLQQLRLTLAERESQIDAISLQLADSQHRLQQKDAHYQYRIEILKKQLSKQTEPVTAELSTFMDNSLIVHNWRDSWKWISNWCFGLVMFFAVTPIPPELLAVLPEHVRFYVIAWVAFCGLVGRYINQNRAGNP